MSFTVEALKIYSFEIDYDKKYKKEKRQMSKNYTEKEGHDVISKERERLMEEENLSAGKAYTEAIRLNPEAADAYLKGGQGKDESGDPSASDEIYAKVYEIRKLSGFQLTYDEALTEVQNDPENAELMKRYAFGG